MSRPEGNRGQNKDAESCADSLKLKNSPQKRDGPAARVLEARPQAVLDPRQLSFA